MKKNELLLLHENYVTTSLEELSGDYQLFPINFRNNATYEVVRANDP